MPANWENSAVATGLEKVSFLSNSKERQSQRMLKLLHWMDWCWSWSSNTLATWCKELTQWKRPWWWEGLKAGGEGDNGGWDGWMASSTQWTQVWANSERQWRTEKPGLLQSVGSQNQTRLSDWTAAQMLTQLYMFLLQSLNLTSAGDLCFKKKSIRLTTVNQQ